MHACRFTTQKLHSMSYLNHKLPAICVNDLLVRVIAS